MTGQVTLGQLQALGLVSANPLVRREINIQFHPLKPKEQWADPETEELAEDLESAAMEVFLRRFTAADRIAFSEAKTQEDAAYLAIHRTVFTAEGDRVFPTLDLAYGLDLMMFAPLVKEIRDLNGIGGPKKKSPPKTKHGASSRSSSARRSKKSSSASAPKSSTSGSNTESATAP